MQTHCLVLLSSITCCILESYAQNYYGTLWVFRIIMEHFEYDIILLKSEYVNKVHRVNRYVI